jgi:hypothetical protein
MTPLRIAVAVVVAVLLLLIAGCVVFGIGTNDDGDVGNLLTTPTVTSR